MTNTTLERAARAVSEAMASVPAKAMSNAEWIDFERRIARAVLMAVRSEMCDTVCVGVIDDILSGSTHERATENPQQG